MTRLKRIARLVISVLTPQVQEILSNRYNVPFDVVEEVIIRVKRLNERTFTEPRTDLFIEWIIKNIGNGHLQWPEDSARGFRAYGNIIYEIADHEARSAIKFLFPDKNPRNILDFTLQDLEEIEEERAHPTDRKTNALQENLPQGSKLVYSGDGWSVVGVTDPHAACVLGKGTNWCTRHVDDEGVPSTAAGYLDISPLFIFYKGVKKVAQLHIGRAGAGEFQLKDLRNEDMYPSRELRMVLLKLGFIQDMLNSVRGQISDAAWELETIIGDSPFPEAEGLLAQYSTVALNYAMNFLKGRFPLGEEAILDDPDTEERYRHFLIKIGEERGVRWKHGILAENE